MAWIIFLSAVGVVLICLEVFLPGMVAGTLGGILLFAAVVLTYMEFGAQAGNKALIGLIISSGIALALWISLFPKTRMGRKMVTQFDLAESKTATDLQWLIGKSGTSLTPLRPAGTATIANQRIDVVAESGWIEQNSTIQVVAVEGNRVSVRQV